MRIFFQIDRKCMLQGERLIDVLTIYLYSKTSEEHARDEAMGTDSPGIYHFCIELPESSYEMIRVIQSGINEMLSLHELNLNGEQPCQPNQK